MKIEINKSLYLFFFEDEGFLRQAFLQIKEEEIHDNILDELKTIGPKLFAQKINGDNINDNEFYAETEKYNLYILSKFDINLEKISKELDKINEEANLKSKKLTDKNNSP